MSADILSTKPGIAEHQAGTVTPTAANYRRIGSDVLFGQYRELLIEHGGNEYRLRITGQGKLILTK